jgi:hypothetical protein
MELLASADGNTKPFGWIDHLDLHTEESNAFPCTIDYAIAPNLAGA